MIEIEDFTKQMIQTNEIRKQENQQYNTCMLPNVGWLTYVFSRIESNKIY